MTREDFIEKWKWGWRDPVCDREENNSIVRADLDELLKQEAIGFEEHVSDNYIRSGRHNNEDYYFLKIDGMKSISETEYFTRKDIYQLYKDGKN